MTTNSPRSAFADALGSLLEAMDLSQTRAASLFGVSKAAVSQWLSDRSLPRPGTLHTMLEYAREHAPSEAYQRFLELASRRAVQTSTRFRGDVESVGAYLLRPLEKEALAALRKLPVADQETVLRDLKDTCERQQTKPGVVVRIDHKDQKGSGREAIAALLKSNAAVRVSDVALDGMASQILRAWARNARTEGSLLAECPDLQEMLVDPVRTCQMIVEALRGGTSAVTRSDGRVHASR